MFDRQGHNFFLFTARITDSHSCDYSQFALYQFDGWSQTHETTNPRHHASDGSGRVLCRRSFAYLWRDDGTAGRRPASKRTSGGARRYRARMGTLSLGVRGSLWVLGWRLLRRFAISIRTSELSVQLFLGQCSLCFLEFHKV